MLTLGQAFIAKPRLLMIDELSLGLAPIIVEQLLEIVRAIRDRGTTIILVEQSVNVALTVAETAYFMEKGEIRFHGPTERAARAPRRPALGVPRGGRRCGRDERDQRSGAAAERRRTIAACGGRRPCSTSTASAGRSAASPPSTTSRSTSREGEILGIIGPNGAGKTTLFDLDLRLPAPGRGPHHPRTATTSRDLGPEARARLGLGRSFQDARLFPALTVAETIDARARTPGRGARPDRRRAQPARGRRLRGEAAQSASTS